jgi:hypothetical protein
MTTVTAAGFWALARGHSSLSRIYAQYRSERPARQQSGAAVTRRTLCVVGASTFPTAGRYNPTLTVQAIVWMSAEAVIDQWSRRSHG